MIGAFFLRLESVESSTLVRGGSRRGVVSAWSHGIGILPVLYVYRVPQTYVAYR
jgi:hypothetical protein